MAVSVEEEALPRLTELPIPVLNEVFQYTDVRFQAALRRTCALFHLLLPCSLFYRDIRIFISPTTPVGSGEYFRMERVPRSRGSQAVMVTLRKFRVKCRELLDHSPQRTVIIDGPYDRICQLTDFCVNLDSIEDLHFQRLIFVRQTFRDPIYLSYFCQNYLKKKNICQQVTFHDVLFSQLQNVHDTHNIIGQGMGRDERKAYMLQQQIIPIRGSLDVHAARFDHDLLELIERHCPEVNEEQMAEIMQWKAAIRDDRWGIGFTLWGFVGNDDRPCNTLYSKGWNAARASPELVEAARSVDVRQMTKIARTAFFYSMKQAAKENDQRTVLH